MTGAGRQAGNGRVRLVAALLVVLAVSGCRTPVGVKRVDPERVHRDLTRNVLTQNRPSAESAQALHRDDLTARFQSDPAGALEEMRQRWIALPGSRRLFALAELSFLHAQNGGGRPFYLAAAAYAYNYLFPGRGNEHPDPFDPRLRVAATLYNRGLTDGLLGDAERFVDLSPRRLALPFGEFVLESRPDKFAWSNRLLIEFVPVAELQVRGLANRHRRAGIGAPVAARIGPLAPGREALLYERWLPPRVRVPSTVFVRLAGGWRALAQGRLSGKVELYKADTHEWLKIDGRRVPLEYEPTAAMAYSLQVSNIWSWELAGFLGREVDVDAQTNLVMLQPHRRGKIPVVLVHGTASSPARWVEMINELGSDPRLRPHIEFWLFFYKTGNPILHSAALLRQALTDAVQALDPQGRDPGLQRLVVIGHSQGGLLTRLQAVDSGNAFWANLSDQPFESFELAPELREVLAEGMFFEAVPQVRRLVFIATPHGGSYLAGERAANLAARLVRLPATLAEAGSEMLQSKDERALRETYGRIPSSIDNMRPGNPFLVTLAGLPTAEGVKSHSIIAVRSRGSVFGQGDGVVKYESAHIEGVESEKIVISAHSGAQDHPDTVTEVRRILLEHIAD